MDVPLPVSATEPIELRWPAFPPDPAARVPLTPTRFAKGVLPFFALYQLIAVLACTPGTKLIRRGLLPVALALAYRAVTVYDASLGGALPNLVHCVFGCAMPICAARMSELAIANKPYVRSWPPSRGAILDGLDLLNNQRGLGWCFGRHTPIPSNPHASATRLRFIFATLTTVAKDTFVLVMAPFALALLSPSTFSTPEGGPIFHPDLPPFLRLLHASAVTALSGAMIWHGIELAYQVGALVTFLLPHIAGLPPADPALWPPLALPPWYATSLRHFWTNCWHPLIRNSLVAFGAKPGGRIAGRTGAVLGAFAVSEVLHDIGFWALGRGIAWPGFFVLMGVGVVLEQAFTQVTGRKVGGWAGRIWTFGWVVGWGTRLLDSVHSLGLKVEIELPAQLQGWALPL